MNENSLPMAATAQALFDQDIRRAIRENPRQYAIDQGVIPADSTVEVKLVISEPGQMAIPVFKIGAGSMLSTEQLSNITGGVRASTVGSVLSGGTASTITSTAWCVSSISSVGSAAGFVEGTRGF